MRGVIIAGGSGNRLRPLTRGVSKQLLPVYDKPLIYYPLSTLLLAGVTNIAVVTTPDDVQSFERLLGDGSQWGVSITLVTQDRPRGIADALALAGVRHGGEPVALVLGDNVFYGTGLGNNLKNAMPDEGALIFAYRVADPRAYGVVEFDENRRVLSLVEKPAFPRSSYAVPGLYFYDASVWERLKTLRPSSRGELEITDLNETYLNDKLLKVDILPRGTTWFDTGSFDDFAAAGEFVRVIEKRQGLKVGCLEEIAWRNGLIDDAGLEMAARRHRRSEYGDYLSGLLREAARS